MQRMELPNLAPYIRELPANSRVSLSRYMNQFDIQNDDAVMFIISYGDNIRAEEDRYGIRRLRLSYAFPYTEYEDTHISYMVLAKYPTDMESNGVELYASAILTGEPPTYYDKLQIYDDTISVSEITNILIDYITRITASANRLANAFVNRY